MTGATDNGPSGKPRCEDCGCFVYRISEDNYTCCNSRCASSWQTTKADFDSSMLGAACRQLLGGGNA